MLSNRKKVALVTASHLSSCPRLLKEAELLSSKGFEIHIVYLNSVPRIDELDNELVKKNNTWNLYPIYWYGKKCILYKKWISKLKFKFYQILNIKTDYIQSTSDILIKTVLNIKADLYIAHHPSVLVAVAKAANKYNAKYIYDVEDAFSFMETMDNYKPDPFVFHVENKYIHNSSLLTFASPLYKELYLKSFHVENKMFDVLNLFKHNDVSVNDYFDRKDLTKISFYWHSQTIGLNRGLQDVILALSKFNNNKWELHIRGHYTEEVKSILLKNVNNEDILSNIYFHKAVPSYELPIRTKEHDIGLALESNISINRDLCITNKILEYIASGLMVIATNTKGHIYIMDKLGALDLTYTNNNVDELVELLTKIFNHPEVIQVYKEKSKKLAVQEMNLDTQSQKWLLEIMEILK